MERTNNGKEAVRLCEHIIRQAFGDVIARVSSTLLNRGRLSASALARLSGLPPRLVLGSLVVLIQHHLVLSTGETAKEEQYEFNVEECLLRLRYGRILAVTRERLGEAALEVIRQLIMFGKLRAPDISEACGGALDQSRELLINSTTLDLVQNHYVEPFAPELGILRSERVNRSYKERLVQKQVSSGSKLLSETSKHNCRAEAEEEIEAVNEGLRHTDRILVRASRPLKKKKKDEKKRAGKEKPDDDVELVSLRSDVFLRINHDRFGLLVRDQAIVQAATTRWNRGAGIIMRELLEEARLDGEDVPVARLRDVFGHQHVRTEAVVKRVERIRKSELKRGIVNGEWDAMSSGIVGGKSVEAVVDNYLRVIAAEDLAIGSGSPFLVNQGGMGGPYRLQLEMIGVMLRASLLSDLVRQNLGDAAARVLAAVLKAKYASETIIRDNALVSLKQLRTILPELQKLNLIETHDIPKTAGGKAARPLAGVPISAGEHHYWHLDLARAYAVLLAGLYKTLGNLIHRRETEVAKSRPALLREAKVLSMGHGHEQLGERDKRELEELEDKRRKLDLAIARTEGVVFVMRDLPGWPRV
nr:DNA-directed RNA polymerase III subunit RPC3 [Naematelia aurantialba]